MVQKAHSLGNKTIPKEIFIDTSLLLQHYSKQPRGGSNPTINRLMDKENEDWRESSVDKVPTIKALGLQFLPQNHTEKPSLVVSTHNPSTGKVETSRFLRFTASQFSLISKFQNRRWMVPKKQHLRLTSLLHTDTQPYSQNKKKMRHTYTSKNIILP